MPKAEGQGPPRKYDNLMWLEERFGDAVHSDTEEDTEAGEEEDEEAAIPVTARALQHSEPEAWQVFLNYAAATFGLLCDRARQESGMALCAKTAKVNLLGAACKEVSESTSLSLQQLRCSGEGPLPRASRAAGALQEVCEVKALIALQELELELLRKSKDTVLEALQHAASSSEKAGALLLDLRRLREVATKRHLARKAAKQAKAQALLMPLEAAIERLKACQQQKSSLLRVARARICRAVECTGPGAGVLLFRGRHKLRISPCTGSQGVEPMYCIRFVPFLPGALCRDAAKEAPLQWQLVLRFQDLICRIWLRALGPELAAGASAAATVPRQEVPGIIHRLQMGLLDAADLLKSVVAAMQRPQLQLPPPPVIPALMGGA
ncbi:unnamed protein product [Symbiodinium sp. CCMP2592]|nr:unnamed protein product [Symbiodinium sp. CCMP2592]